MISRLLKIVIALRMNSTSRVQANANLDGWQDIEVLSMTVLPYDLSALHDLALLDIGIRGAFVLPINSMSDKQFVMLLAGHRLRDTNSGLWQGNLCGVQ